MFTEKPVALVMDVASKLKMVGAVGLGHTFAQTTTAVVLQFAIRI